jgi:Spy/CpxP family protein refolding chaperone
MLGFLIGTVCLIGLIKVVRRGRRWGYGGGFGGPFAYGGAMCGHDGHAYGGPWRGGPWGARGGFGRNFFLRALFERLDTTPGQEKAIRAALDDLRVTAKSVRAEVSDARADVARAMRADHMDEFTLSDVSAKVTVAGETMRTAVTTALSKIHEALDERQRATLADFIESGPGFGHAYRWGGGGGRGGWGSGGPYRGGPEVV